MDYIIGERQVFLSRGMRDKKAYELEKIGYTIEKYDDGAYGYYIRVLAIPSHALSDICNIDMRFI